MEERILDDRGDYGRVGKWPAINPEFLPYDGRFGSGPTKVRRDAIDDLVAHSRDIMGTSHRRLGVTSMVGRLRAALKSLFELPKDWEIVLGNGGATTFWDAASYQLIGKRSQHLSFGEFSAKFAEVVRAAPHLDDPWVIESEPGTHPVAEPGEVDAYAFTHNETSTGVTAELTRPVGGQWGALVLVDATSAAGAIGWLPKHVDVYYFSPQKAFAADGGLWIAAVSPAAQERIGELAASGRHTPASLDLSLALTSAKRDQTYNTPALATLLMTLNTTEWLLDSGGMAHVVDRCGVMSGHIYSWAQERPWAQPFVADPAKRSPVVCTIDFDGVSADDLAAALRANGILDVEGYRKLGRNQLRIGTFPAIDLADLMGLTASIDFLVPRLIAEAEAAD